MKQYKRWAAEILCMTVVCLVLFAAMTSPVLAYTVERGASALYLSLSVQQQEYYNAMLEAIENDQNQIVFENIAPASATSYNVPYAQKAQDIKKAAWLLLQDKPDCFWLHRYMEFYIRQEVKDGTRQNWSLLIVWNPSSDYYGSRANNSADSIFYWDNRIEPSSEKMSAKADAIVAVVNGRSDYEQVKYFHDWIIDNTVYDVSAIRDYYSNYRLYGDPSYGVEHVYTMEGVFLKGEAVCEGYAKAFEYLCDKAGIPCVMVTGVGESSSGSENHAWNYVKLDGKWYLVDTTWDDPVTSNGQSVRRYDYFLKGSSSPEAQSHIPQTAASANSGYDYIDYPALSESDYDPEQSGKEALPKELTQAQMLSIKEENGAVKVYVSGNVFVKRETLKKAQEKFGGETVLRINIVEDRKVTTQMSLKLADADKLKADELFLGVQQGNETTRALFKRYFSNDMQIISFVQEGEFGPEIKIATKIDLSGLNTDTLRFLSYNREKNSFKELDGADYYIDQNGYLHFDTHRGGDILIIDENLIKRSSLAAA